MVTRIPESATDPLDELASEAQDLGNDAAGAANDALAGGAAPGQAVRLTNSQCVAMALQTIREALCAIAKVTSPKRTLDDATVQTCADAVGPVFDKYRIDLSGMAGDYMVEFRAVATVVPIILAARAELVAELRAKKATRVEPSEPPAPETGADMGPGA